MPDYDVIIVGGRVAGSTLAAYLGQKNMRVLLLERAVMPQEHPASSPIIQPVTMAMLDEIDADENLYAHNTPPIHKMIAIDGDLRWELDIPEVGRRNYAYAIDRARFDATLWKNALRHKSVKGIDGFGVTNLLWDETGTTVIGIEGKHLKTNREEHFMAQCVIGADGRFSTVARKVGAKERDKHDENPTTLYYGYWENVKPFENFGATAVSYASESGTHGYLLMDSVDKSTVVVIEGRSDTISAPGGEIEAYYHSKLAEHPLVMKRLENAKLVTGTHGMRKISNMFREAGGEGWALVGDAYYQKDPIDGQGIYDAIYTARTLAKALIAWNNGKTHWDDTIKWYDETARAKTEPQYRMTLNRVQQSLYPNTNLHIPKKLLEVPLGWLAKDPQYQRIAGLALNRQIDPTTPLQPKFMAIAMLRGSLRELSEKLNG